jgi:hypothetical protein
MTLIFLNFNMTHLKSPMAAPQKQQIERHHDEKAALPALCCMHSSMPALLCLHV